MPDLQASAAAATTASFAAVSSLASDAAANLSPPASALVSALMTAATSSLGSQLQSLVAQGESALADALGEEIAGIVGDAVGSFPIVGTLYKIVFAAVAAGSAQAAADAEAIQRGCSDWLRSSAPRPIDSVSLTPADIFAPVFVQQGGDYGGAFMAESLMQYVGPGDPNAEMSGLGWALTVVTEGHSFTPASLAATTAYLQMIMPTSSATGVPKATRAHFRALRKAIQAQLGVVGSTEGGDLWPIYLDMLNSEIASGRLNMAFMTMLLNAAERGAGAGGEFDENGKLSFNPCNKAPLAQQILDMASKWNALIHPVTAQDQKALHDFTTGVEAAVQAALAQKRNPASLLRPSLLASLFGQKSLSGAETVAQALRHGWSPALDGKLPSAMTFVLLLEKIRAAAARPHLSPAALAKFRPPVNLFR